MKEYRAVYNGDHIGEVAERAIKWAQGEDCFFIFNDFCIPISDGSTVESVCKQYQSYLAQNSATHAPQTENKPSDSGESVSAE